MAASILVGLVTLTFLTSASASGTTLPFTSFKQMVVDPINNHVFVSAGATGTFIAVMNCDGTLDTTITNELGASGMVLVGADLWVAAQNNDTISEIDTSTLSRVHSYSTGAVTKPNNLAYAGGLLWFSYGECGYWEGGIASMDPSDGTITTYASSTGFPSYCPNMTSFPSLPNTLFTWESGLEPPTINEYDVSGAPTLEVSRFMVELAFVRQVALSPDGTKLLAAAGAPYSIKSFRLSDLQPSGTDYPTGPYPTGVEVTTVGGGQIAAGLDAPYDPDVYVFPEDDPTPSYSYDFNTSDPSAALWDAGLAFSPDATRLFAVTGDFGDAVIFNVLTLSASSSTTSTSTSSTISLSSSTTTTRSSSTTSITSTTSTTLPCSDNPRCALDVATKSGACADDSVPSSITGKLNRAASLAGQIPTASPERAKRLRKRASRLLQAAGNGATKLARGKKPKLSSACAAAIANAAGAERQGLRSP